jgi:hypothetical protein
MSDLISERHRTVLVLMSLPVFWQIWHKKDTELFWFWCLYLYSGRFDIRKTLNYSGSDAFTCILADLTSERHWTILVLMPLPVFWQIWHQKDTELFWFWCLYLYSGRFDIRMTMNCSSSDAFACILADLTSERHWTVLDLTPVHSLVQRLHSDTSHLGKIICYKTYRYKIPKGGHRYRRK